MQVSTFPLLSFLYLHSLFTSSSVPSFLPSFLSAMEYFSRVPLILLLQYKNTE